jgi:hypothetical protein
VHVEFDEIKQLSQDPSTFHFLEVTALEIIKAKKKLNPESPIVLLKSSNNREVRVALLVTPSEDNVARDQSTKWMKQRGDAMLEIMYGGDIENAAFQLVRRRLDDFKAAANRKGIAVSTPIDAEMTLAMINEANLGTNQRRVIKRYLKQHLNI